MSAKKEGAQRTQIKIQPQHRLISLAIAPTMVGGIEQALDLVSRLIDAAALGDKSAVACLAQSGIEIATASNGTTIVIRKDGTIGAWIV